MANDETPAGFLSRWSRRKAEVRHGVALVDAANSSDNQGKKPGENLNSELQGTDAVNSDKSLVPSTRLVGSLDHEDGQTPNLNSAAQQKPAPSMADVQSLTKDSDYTQFMAGEVAPEVKNAAMKKLFTDPHFNVMDRMDVYIDDYGQPDPLPKAMLRQMASAKFLNLFEDEDDEKKDAQANLNDIPSANDTQVVAQSVPAATISKTEPLTHDHPDLRLQPDPAPRPEGAGSKPV
jgi:hypothetical protein